MSLSLLAFLAFLPIFIAGVLLIGFRVSAKVAMPIVLVVTIAIASSVWDLSTLTIAASTIQGLFVTLDILYIIFGAILLLNLLKYSGGINFIRKCFAVVCPVWLVSVGIFFLCFCLVLGCLRWFGCS